MTTAASAPKPIEVSACPILNQRVDGNALPASANPSSMIPSTSAIAPMRRIVPTSRGFGHRSAIAASPSSTSPRMRRTVASRSRSRSVFLMALTSALGGAVRPFARLIEPKALHFARPHHALSFEHPAPFGDDGPVGVRAGLLQINQHPVAIASQSAGQRRGGVQHRVSPGPALRVKHRTRLAAKLAVDIEQFFDGRYVRRPLRIALVHAVLPPHAPPSPQQLLRVPWRSEDVRARCQL